jgi:hypothetical protein
MKSSLKTFLKGENPYEAIDKQSNICSKLKGSSWLSFATEADSKDNVFEVNKAGGYHYDIWNIDVLDDGTAITYCSDV